MASIKALLDFSVYLDDVTMYNYALNAFQNDLCGGLHGNYHPETGQSAETGRDQGHTITGIGWTAEAARTVQSQGGDLYSLGNNLLLKAAEYSAKYNLNYTVPFDRKFYRCEAILINGPWSEPSPISRGIGYLPSGAQSAMAWDVSYPALSVPTGLPLLKRRIAANHSFQILYYQYVVKRGLSAPWTTKAKKTYDATTGGEQHSK